MNHRILGLLGVALLGTPTLLPSPPDPPLRVRVHLDGEVHVLEVGEEVRTAGGSSLSVEILPTRTFRAPAGFQFDYPRDWQHSGVSGVPRDVDGWWSVSGPGALVYLRLHAGDSAEITRQYLDGLRALAGSKAEPCEITLDGRRMVGEAVEYDVGGIRGGSSRWRQEVYTWSESEGVAWLIGVQRELVPPGTLTWITPTFDLVVGDSAGGQLVVQGSPPPPPGVHDPLDALLASWRWK